MPAFIRSFEDLLAQDPLRWFVIADDLTGACDAGVAFARHGFRTVVLLAPGEAGLPAAEVMVADTDSRPEPPDAARAKVEQVCRRLMSEGFTLIYKKVDSTLRGHVADETGAAMRAAGYGLAVLCPAFPAQGRLVREGRLIAEREGLSVPLPAQESIEHADATSGADLRRLARTLLRRSPPALPAGSAGLARAWAEVLAAALRRPGCDVQPGTTRAPVIFLVGSDQAATQTQLDYLLRRSLAVETGLGQLGARASATARPHFLVRIAELPLGREQIAPLRARIAAGQAGALVLCGGATARAMLAALAADGVELAGEILPGIAWGRIFGGAADGLTVVTKAGGFGEADTFARVLEALAGPDFQR